MITLWRFRQLEAALELRGYGPMIEWSESIRPPCNADEFAERAIYVICNSGMKATVAGPIYHRCTEALAAGESAHAVFGHGGKADAIDRIWAARERFFADYIAADNRLTFLESLPWIGKVTRHHLLKNMGGDEAKPDVHLERLALRSRTTVPRLCARLARQTGYRVATIDTILWRACADGILDSKRYEQEGWNEAVSPFLSRMTPRKI